MFPDQQNQNGGQPQTGINSPPHQAPNGQYDVLPTPSVTGHPSGHNPYEFIVSPQAQHHKGKLFGGNKFAMQLAVLIGGAVVVMIVLAVVISALAPKSSTADLTTIAQTQQEIVRVADEGSQKTVGQDASNLASSVSLNVGSSQQQTLAYLSSHGTTLKTKTLALKTSTQTDTLLATAVTNNTYDSTFTQTMTSELTSYATLLQTTYKHTSSTKVKQLLQNCYSTAALLVKQAQAVKTSN